MKIRVISIPLLLRLFCGCAFVGSPESFPAPEFVSVSVETSSQSAEVSAVVSGSSGISSGGIYLAGGGFDSRRIEGGLMEGNVFSFSFDGLEPDKDYSLMVFLSGGRFEVVSKSVSFRTFHDGALVGEPKFPDPLFEAWLLENRDADRDGRLSREEASMVKSIDIDSEGIASLEGLGYFPNLVNLRCRREDSSGLIEEVDLRYNTLLETVDLRGNRISFMDFTPCPSLAEIRLSPMEGLEEIWLIRGRSYARVDVPANTLVTYKRLSE